MIALTPFAASIPDDRDYPYVTRPGPYRPAVDLIPHVHEVDDQGAVGSCTANASTSACELLKPASYSRLFNYWVTRNTIEYRPGQEGASLRDAVRALRHFGAPLESLWPYVESATDTKPPPPVYADALTRLVTRYERIDCSNKMTSEGQQATINAIKSALSEGLPVIIATAIGQQIMGLTGPWRKHKMQYVNGTFHSDNPAVGYHAMLIIGYDDSTKDPCPGMTMPGSWLVQNSWGRGYGDGGILGYPYAALAFDITEAWVVRGFADVMINQAPIEPYVTEPAAVLGWYHEVWRNDVTDPWDEGVQYWARHPQGKSIFLQTWRHLVQTRCDELLAQL